MQKFLVIQTVRPVIEIALCDEVGVIFAEKKWVSKKDEVQVLIPEILALMKANQLNWSKLDGVIVAVGIGGFSSTRVGVAIANVIGLALEKAGLEVEGFSLRQLIIEKTNEDDLDKILAKQDWNNWSGVDLAQPIYSSSPLISESKKKKFT